MLTINGGEITGPTGVELRSGTLKITDGKITGTWHPTDVNPNGNGATTMGAAVAIAQHTTLKTINVEVSGGYFFGYTPFIQVNPQGNSDESVAMVTLNINGGYFETINDGENAIYSENKKEFIETGTFVGALDESYIVEGSSIIPADEDISVVVPNVLLVDDNDLVEIISDEILPKGTVIAVNELTEEAIKEATKIVEEKYEEDKKVKDVKLLAIYDISLEKAGTAVEVEEGKFTVVLRVSRDLLKYDHYKVLFFDENGVVKEELDAQLLSDVVGDLYSKLLGQELDDAEEITLDDEEDDGIVFETTHFSTYGIVGYNDVKETKVDNNVDTTNPDTIDNAYLYTAFGIISLIAGAYVFNKLRKNA